MSIICEVDLNAQYYRNHSNLQYGLASELLDDYQFNRSGNVLDIGCGDGRITASIASRVPNGKVIGIDASASMINCAAVTFPKSKFPNLEFQLNKAENVSFTDHFDAIVSFSCFHWVREPEKALDLLCDLMKSKGDLMILAYPKESLYYKFMQDALEFYPEYKHKSAHQTMLSIDEYKTILKRNGLDIQEFYSRELVASYKNKESIKDFIRGWLTSFVPLPEHLHEEYLDLVIEKSLPYSKDLQNEMINLPYTALIIKAKK